MTDPTALPSREGAVRAFARETAAGGTAVARVRARLGVVDREEIAAILETRLPAPRTGAAARVRARLARPPAKARPWVALGVVVAGSAVGAAIAAVLVAIGVLGGGSAATSGPAPLAAVLASEAAWAALAPTDDVRLDFRGTGALAGDARAPRVEWEVGTLRVEVVPDRNVDLRVRTREADVRVVGTGFEVERDALGTRVAVVHGRVAVICADGQDDLLGAGETRTCLPTNASGLLGRARALAERGAPAGDVLAAAEAGLAAAPSGLVQGELALVRVEALGRLGRSAEALAAAGEALAAPGARTEDLRRLAARHALASSGCDAALPHLAALAAGPATGPELVQYADCVAPTDPEAARAALRAALAGGVPEEHAEGIRARLDRLSFNRGNP